MPRWRGLRVRSHRGLTWEEKPNDQEAEPHHLASAGHGRHRRVGRPDELPGPPLGGGVIPSPYDPEIIAWAALFIATLALALAVGMLVTRLLSRPRPEPGREVTSVDTIFRRSEVPEDTVPLVRPGTIYGTRNGRRR